MRRVPLGVMLETPSGVYKTLIVDNVGKLEDSIAHVIPEAPSHLGAPAACLVLIFLLDCRMGLAALVTLPLSVPVLIGIMRGYWAKMATHLKADTELHAAMGAQGMSRR